MELWIRSQDRTFLRKVNTIGIVEGRDFWSIDESLTISFGEYKTKERALEVLDEIQKLLMPTIEYNPVVKKEESWEEEYQRTVLKGYDVKIEQAITYVYEMPKE